MNNKKVISALKLNIASCKIFIKGKINPILKAEVTGMMKGYQFAIMLLENPSVTKLT